MATGRSAQGNANIEPDLLRPWLLSRGHDPEVVTKAIAELQRAARMDGLKLYEANRATYDMLRYGVQVTPGPGEAPVTVRFVDWDNPAANDLGVAEEVAITAKNPKAYNKRPDLVIYVNGIALGVVELKKSTVERGRRHPPDAGQPAARVHPALLHHGADHLRRQRHAGPALCRDPDPAALLAGLEGRQRDHRAARPRRGADADARAVPGTDQRFHPVRRGHQEGHPPQPVFRREGRAGGRARAQRAGSSGRPKAREKA